MDTITLQLHQHGEWHDAMTIKFLAPDSGLASRCITGYCDPYLFSRCEEVGSILASAVSAAYPLDWDVISGLAPAFLHDMIPGGAARRSILQYQSVPAGVGEEFFLLSNCTPAPIGHLRVKESVAAMGTVSEPVGFPREEVIERDTRFLAYAYECGAAIGGATGAGGEAPKLLLVEDQEGYLHPDATLEDHEVAQHWFIKFPRNNANETDRNILRSEFCYYQVLNQLGIDTISGEGLAYEVARKPSLWMHRFDRRVMGSEVERVAVESIYSLCGTTRHGSRLAHERVIAKLAETWTSAGQAVEIPAMIAEYLRRDLINQVLGNSDNHGRNQAILREEHRIRFAPIYDLAPMVMDEEGITRVTKWARNIEEMGQVNWRAACDTLAGWGEPEMFFEGLRRHAAELLALPDLLSQAGLPEETWRAPMIPLNRLDRTFANWGLL